jgi:hypothetical protein
MRGKLILLAAVATAACLSPDPVEVAGTIPARFQGVFDQSREACGRASEYRLTVTGRELRFHESVGTVREVRSEGPDAIRIAADYQGEGESWQAMQELRLAEGGATLTIAGEGVNLTRVRCAP